MVLREIPIDNSVRLIPKKEQTKEKEIKQKTIKGGSLARKQNKNSPQNNIKLFKNISAQGFKYLK